MAKLVGLKSKIKIESNNDGKVKPLKEEIITDLGENKNTNNKPNIYFIEGKIICMLREVYNPYLNLNKPQVKKFWLRKLEWFKLFQFEDIQDFMNIAELFKTED